MQLFQHAYVVTDLEASAQRWRDLFGAGPFHLARHHRTDRFTYRGTGEEADVSYAFGYLGDLMIQLIRQEDDQRSIYSEMYDREEEGFHHVAYLVEALEPETERLTALGYELACELSANGLAAAYFDTREAIGGFTEIHEYPPRAQELFTRWRAEHAALSPSTPTIIEGV